METIAARVLTQAAKDAEADIHEHERYTGEPVWEFSREYMVLKEATRIMLEMSEAERLVAPMSALKTALQRLEHDLLDRAWSKERREALPYYNSAYSVDSYINDGYADAFTRICGQWQFVGTEAERAVASWFWGRLIDRTLVPGAPRS
jgi:predicted nucleic acid-binding protein